jgi:hypothetical protein
MSDQLIITEYLKSHIHFHIFLLNVFRLSHYIYVFELILAKNHLTPEANYKDDPIQNH